VFDSGDYGPALDQALELAAYEATRKEQQDRRNAGANKRIGIGLSCYVEMCGLAPSRVLASLNYSAGGWEAATVRLMPTGKVQVVTGSTPHGQGHETCWSQIVADRLGVDPDDVDVVSGDTALSPAGMDTYGSRSLAVGGVAVVEVDSETGDVDLIRYVAVDDCGNQVNPMIVEGQVHGGVVQGIAQALYEEAVYDQDGNLRTSTLTDYLVPSAAEVPSFTLGHTVTPSPTNPMGVKGVGEAGTIASTPAVMNAVLDALAPLGVTALDMPASPQRVWEAMERAKKAAEREGR